MNTISVNYQTFKSCMEGLEVFWTTPDTGLYSMATAYGTTVIVCSVEGSEATDFQTWSIPGNQCPDLQEASVRALFSPKAKLRIDVRQKPFTNVTRDLALVGYRFEAALNGDSHFDIQYPEEREIQAANVEVKNHSDGDYIEFDAYLPANAMGPGSPEVLLTDWARTIYLGPSGQKGYDANDAKTLPAGIIIRVKYHSVATSGPAPVLYFDIKAWK